MTKEYCYHILVKLGGYKEGKQLLNRKLKRGFDPGHLHDLAEEMSQGKHTEIFDMIEKLDSTFNPQR